MCLIELQYLANMASKSANYCVPSLSGGEGLLLLCETQLGKPMYQCKRADPDAFVNCIASVLNISEFANLQGSIATHGIG